jgi:hypothetical protein
MNKLKIFMWIAATLAIGLIFIPNQALYLLEQRLSLNLLGYEIAFRPVHNGLIILLVFFSGALLAGASSITGRFARRRALKNCKTTAEGYLDKIGELKKVIDQLKGGHAAKGAWRMVDTPEPVSGS